MGISLTVFIGARDPLLMAKLNSCQTACCLVDPDDISEYEGYLPAFLGADKERILQFSKNIFMQSQDPGFVFEIDESRSSREVYEEIRMDLTFALNEQLELIEEARLYQEIELQNALINFPSMLMGRKVSDLKKYLQAKTGFVLWDEEISKSVQEKLNDVKGQVLVVAAVSSIKELSRCSVMPDVLVLTGSEKCETEDLEEFFGVPLVADVASRPGLVKNFEKVYWSSCPHFLELDKQHVEFVDFESQWSEGRDARLLGLSVALHLVSHSIFINTQFNAGFELLSENLLKEVRGDQELIYLDTAKDISIKAGELKESLSLGEVCENVSAAIEFISTMEKDIDSEYEGEVLHSVLRACDHDNLIKMGNGFINYGLINYQESDLTKKKSYFLSVVRELKEILQQEGLSEYQYRQQVSEIFSGRELFWDFDFEVKVLAHSNPRLSLALDRCHRDPFESEFVRYSFAHKFKVDLELKKNGAWLPYRSQSVEIDEWEERSIEENGIIIVAGLLDGQLQLDLLELYPEVPIVTLVNEPKYMAELLKYVPLVSLLGRRGLWVHGTDEELSVAYKTLLAADHVQPIIIDPDPDETCYYITEFKKYLGI
jgi:hypothetical protein